MVGVNTYSWIKWGCHDKNSNAKYFMDSPCFDHVYRCEVECSNYELKFTGITNGCSCDCGTGWVSACSGFYFDKINSSEDKIRITGEEIVKYPNGTEVPLGIEEGIYKVDEYNVVKK